MRIIIYSLFLIQIYYKDGCANDDYDEKYVSFLRESSRHKQYTDSDELIVRHTLMRASEEHHEDSDEVFVRHTTKSATDGNIGDGAFDDEFFDSHSDERYGKGIPSSREGSTNNYSMKYCDWNYKKNVIKLFKKCNKSEIDEEHYMEMKHDVHLLDAGPDIGNASIVPRGAHFSIFVRKHYRAMLDLVHYFIKAESACDLWEMAHRVKPLVNIKLFTFALSSVLTVKDFGVDFPAVFETVPIDFIPSKFVKAIDKMHQEVHGVIDKMKNETRDKRQVGNGQTITWRRLQRGVYEVNSIADLSARSRDWESRTSYFRDDYGANSHHYNWHLVHLDDNSLQAWQRRVPRRMEYFMYVHQQMLARYNFERLSCRMPVVEAWGDDLREPIAEGYVPNLGHDSDDYATRPPNMTPMTGRVFRRKEDLRRQIDRGMRLRLINDEMFLQTLELYHDDGHLLISQMHRESERGGQRVGVMFESQTSMRDPVFYRYHQHIDDMWLRYQDVKARTGRDLISYQSLEVRDLAIRYVSVSTNMNTGRSSELVTGCNIFAIEATNGFDFDGNEEVYVRLTHLDHIPFTYHIGVEHQGRSLIHGMVRIFMAPRLDVNGQELDFEEQRRLWIEMDKFTHVFNPGRNVITRGSNQSTVAVNCRNTFRDVTERITQAHGQLTHGGHCGCGWPQHLLLPRGWDGEGMPVQIFVMVTDENHIDHRRQPSRSTYCGIPGQREPDEKPMGYPFHYRAPKGTRSIRDYHERLPNAYVRNVRLRFSGRQVDLSKPDTLDCPHR